MSDKEKLQAVIELLTRLADNIDKTECVLKKAPHGFLAKGNLYLTVNLYAQMVGNIENSHVSDVNIINK